MSIGVGSSPLALTHELRRIRSAKRQNGSLRWITPVLAQFLLMDIALAQGANLSSWNDSVARKEVVRMIAKIEDTNNPAYLPPQDRVAVFDIDGTLWPERPTSIAGAFYIDRIKEHFHKFSNLGNFKHDDDRDRSKGGGLVNDRGFDVDSVEDYKRDVRDWLSTALHPSLKVQYNKLVYTPMHQLIAFLQSNGFKVYLITAAESDFMKAASEELFGVPPAQVIGTQMFSKLSKKEEGISITKTHIPRFINSRSNKVIAINESIGTRPIIAFGNSEGDREMLRWVASGSRWNRSFLIKHDDRDREFKYDDEIFKEEGGSEHQRAEDRLIVVSIKKDWKRVFQWQ
jgi:phosphoserine phosphatase